MKIRKKKLKEKEYKNDEDFEIFLKELRAKKKENNIINELLERKKEKRLGYNGFDEIKNHPWLIDFNWEDLKNKRMQPFFIPPFTDNNYDKKYCNEPEIMIFIK